MLVCLGRWNEDIDHRHSLYNGHNLELVHLNQVKEMHTTILGIWTTDILEACYIIKDATNNGIRPSSGSLLCKQEQFVELSGGKKSSISISPSNALALQSGLPEILGMVQNPECLGIYLILYFCNFRAQRKGCTRNRLTHFTTQIIDWYLTCRTILPSRYSSRQTNIFLIPGYKKSFLCFANKGGKIF